MNTGTNMHLKQQKWSYLLLCVYSLMPQNLHVVLIEIKMTVVLLVSWSQHFFESFKVMAIHW